MCQAVLVTEDTVGSKTLRTLLGGDNKQVNKLENRSISGRDKLCDKPGCCDKRG